MSTWQERVREELDQLNERLEKLDEFLKRPESRVTASIEQLALLQKQRSVMVQYSSILAQRLATP